MKKIFCSNLLIFLSVAAAYGASTSRISVNNGAAWVAAVNPQITEMPLWKPTLQALENLRLEPELLLRLEGPDRQATIGSALAEVAKPVVSQAKNAQNPMELKQVREELSQIRAISNSLNVVPPSGVLDAYRGVHRKLILLKAKETAQVLMLQEPSVEAVKSGPQTRTAKGLIRALKKKEADAFRDEMVTMQDNVSNWLYSQEYYKRILGRIQELPPEDLDGARKPETKNSQIKKKGIRKEDPVVALIFAKPKTDSGFAQAKEDQKFLKRFPSQDIIEEILGQEALIQARDQFAASHPGKSDEMDRAVARAIRRLILDAWRDYLSPSRPSRDFVTYSFIQ